MFDCSRVRGTRFCVGPIFCFSMLYLVCAFCVQRTNRNKHNGAIDTNETSNSTNGWCARLFGFLGDSVFVLAVSRRTTKQLQITAGYANRTQIDGDTAFYTEDFILYDPSTIPAGVLCVCTCGCSNPAPPYSAFGSTGVLPNQRPVQSPHRPWQYYRAQYAVVLYALY